MKHLLIISSLILLLFSCTKHKIRNKCCESGIEIIPASYTSDSVTIWAPQLFTPNGDGINDFFYLQGVGWTMKSMKINSGYSTIFETSDPMAKWDGAKNGKIKDGYYKYTIEIESIHGETLTVSGAVCAFSFTKKRLQNAEEDRYCDCSTGDMIDPYQGFIYSSVGCQ